jgi:hypothetical protein
MAHRDPLCWHRPLPRQSKRSGTLSGPAKTQSQAPYPGDITAGEIISERRARLNRNGGRNHLGFAGDIPRNPHPGEGTLDDPSVAAKPLAAVDAAGCDVPSDAAAAAASMVVGFVGVQFFGASARAATLVGDGRYGVEQRLEWRAVVDVRRSGRMRAGCLGSEVALGALLATVGRVWSERGTASRRRLSSSRCKRSRTPAACPSRSRRQQVTPEPQPTSRGSISPGDAGAQNEQDAGQCCPCRDRRTPASRLGALGWQQRGKERPKVVRNQRRAHPSS